MNRLIPLFALLVSVMSASAQQSIQQVDPQELVALRAEHLRNMKRAEIAPLTSYLQSLAYLKQQFVRESKPAAAAAVQAEIKLATDDLGAANAATNLTTAAPVQLQIDQALYGDLQRNRTVDVTAYIQNAFKSGSPSVSLHGTDMAGSTDPAPGVKKSVKIIYTFNGRRKEKTVIEGVDATLDFKRDLK